MFKFVKICFFGILIFACSCLGFKITHSDEIQASFFAPQITVSPPPSKYDLRNHIDIGVENQHTLGICYAFASLTSLETYLALNYNEYYDFSELHFATALHVNDDYYSSVNDALTQGGNFAFFSLYTQKQNSLVLENEMSMTDYMNWSGDKSSRLLTKFKNLTNNHYQIARVNDTITYPQYIGNKSQYSSGELTNFRNKIKNHIMNYGALAGTIHSSSGLTHSTINYKITDNSLIITPDKINKSLNHSISIVGWDDNYTANGEWADSPGAYICLNSWGTSFGDNGYFYVSYNDYFIESSLSGVTNATLSTSPFKFGSVDSHQQKTALYDHVFDEPYPTVYTANIFNTSKYIGQSITHIDSYIEGSATKFYIQFFNSHSSALSSINNINSYIGATKVDDYTLYTKYQLSSPLYINNNYMVVIREISQTKRTHSIGSRTINNIDISPTYYNGSKSFNLVENVWKPKIHNENFDITIPLTFYTNKQYIEVKSFISSKQSLIKDKYVQNNCTYPRNEIILELVNSNINNTVLNNIKITKLYNNNFSNITSNFTFELISSNKISIILNNSITKGSYILSIPCGNTTIYRIFDVTDAVGFSITYHLDGGVAVNPNSYTNLQTSLNLNKPTKAGYIFVGWYINSSFTTPFNPKSLPYSDLNLYAKYDFALPNIVNKSNNISITYSKNLELPINIVASHALLNQYNTLSYQWYKRANENENFSIINGETNPTLTVRNVSDSGLYSCKVTLTISDTSMTNNPVTKVLLPSTETSILVNIKPYIYDMSNVAWNYNEPIAYDNNTHTVELVNLPVGVTATYTNNTQNNIGIYISTATLIYDDMDGNATATPINNLVWEIRRAKIIITIDNIFTETELPLSDIQSKYSCVIESEYFPNHIKSMQDKLSYLCIDFLLVDTSNPNSKTITATTSTFDIYDITIIDGEYRVIVFSISSNNITATNSKGFVQNCTFTASSEPTNKEIDKILKDKNLNIVQCFNFTFSNLQGEQASISIPLERSKLLQNVSAYIYQDGELIKLQTSSSGNNLNILTDNENAIYVLVTNDISKTSNAHIFVISIIICIYIGLYIAAIVSAIKHRNSYYF